jgi:hypothetical protein
MSDHVPLIPHIHAANPFATNDFVASIHKAWEAALQESGGLETTFCFEMVLHYEDFNRIKKFETVAKLTYFPLREQHRSGNDLFGDQDILKVTENRLRRIA